MRKVRLMKQVMDNFAGTKHREIDFGEHTVISGRNESGKTTVGNAHTFVVSNRMLNGSSPDGIRPKDSSGKETDDVVIAVTEVISVDGNIYEIQKSQTQNWNKKQGTLLGNSNTFMINGIPKKEKEFKQFCSENIAPDDVIQFGTSASALLRLDSKKRREKLFGLIPDFTEDDVLAACPELMPVAEILKDGPVEDLIARCRYQLKGRGRGDRGLEGQLDDIPVRIDEANRAVVNVAELEKEDAEIELAIEGLNKNLTVLQAGDDGVKAEAAKVKAKMRSMADEALIALRDRKAAVNMEIRSASNMVDMLKRDITNAEGELSGAKSAIERANSKISGYADLWLKVKGMTFDEKKKICPYCGQQLPDEKVQELIGVFEQNKARELGDIEKNGNAERANIANLNDTISSLEKTISDKKSELNSAEKLLAEKEHEYSQIPSAVSMDDNAEYQELSAKYNELTSQVKEPDMALISAVKMEINQKQYQRTEIQSRILASEKAKTRIASLEEERKLISQQIANIEKQLDLLMQYNKRRGELITSRINSLFEYIEWDLFDFTISGDSYMEICEPKYQGIRYSQLLNGGARILTEADICNTFQKQNGVSLPVFLDNAEAITAETREKFKKFGFQSIFLQAAECDFNCEIMA